MWEPMNPAPPVTRITPRQAIPSRRVPDVILPVLNERDALPWVLERMPDGYTPIVVDNGSTDGSGELAASLGARVVTEPTPGFGAACYAGLTAATAEIVCFMDCDASFDPRELPKVVRPGRARRRGPDARRAPPDRTRRLADPRPRRQHRARARASAAHQGQAARSSAPCAPPGARRCSGSASRTAGSAGRSRWSCARRTPAGESGKYRSSYHPRDGESKVTGTLKGTVRAVKDMGSVLRE